MSFLSNPLLVGGVVAVVGAVAAGGAYMYAKQGTPVANGKKTIMVLSPRDKRFYDTNAQETEKSLEGKRGKTEFRYWKTGPGWSGEKGVVRFLALDGNAYTAAVIDDKPVTVKLPEALRVLWGKDAYEKMPKPLKQILENHVFGVTIVPSEVPSEDKTRVISAENVDKENIKIAMDVLGKRLKNKGKMDWMATFVGVAIGGFLVYILCNIHVLPVALKGG
jgi:hypothetical protein